MTPISSRKYSLIYADPPWLYAEGQSNRPKTYSRMDDRSIRELPVPSIVAPSAALFLWTTNTHIPTALRVMGAWGFEYTTVAFVWSKVTSAGDPRIGMGHYSRQSVELCLLGMRGRLERKSKSVRQLVESVPTEHSEKPQIVRDRILELFGDLPRVELFACHTVPGWDSWGPRNHRGSELRCN